MNQPYSCTNYRLDYRYVWTLNFHSLCNVSSKVKAVNAIISDLYQIAVLFGYYSYKEIQKSASHVIIYL